MTFTQHYDSPLGGILLAADEIGLTGLWFDKLDPFRRTRQQNVGSDLAFRQADMELCCPNVREFCIQRIFHVVLLCVHHGMFGFPYTSV